MMVPITLKNNNMKLSKTFVLKMPVILMFFSDGRPTGPRWMYVVADFLCWCVELADFPHAPRAVSPYK